MKLSSDDKARAALESAVVALQCEAPAYQILADIKRALASLDEDSAPKASPEPVATPEPIVAEEPASEEKTEPVRKAAPKTSRAKKTTEE